MNNLHPVMQSALRGIIAPLPEVICRQTRSGRVTEYTFSGTDIAAVRRAADVRMSQIDPYRSPAVVAQRPTADGFEVVVRYYSVD
ncbi:hypothetical protein K6V90_09515 [Cupriavidus pauculus]|uniref:hypothetical protein n=1 Tax=Cupriavidus pauculus TaxID=82633 RepID=UPI001C931A3F|nr:hypothetical protein [Cupriavidus pauculus]MBY4730769.1 hypothetical protein [Cupriavidus pauculus]